MSTQDMQLVMLDENTIQCTLVITDLTDSAVQPDTHEILLIDPSGAIEDTETTPTEVSVGTYTQLFTVDLAAGAGIWQIVWKIVKDSNPSRIRAKFKVITIDG